MKRHEALAALSSDHHKGLSMAKLCKSAAGLNDAEIKIIREKCKEFFETELAEHFAEEESILVPPLTANELIKRMLEEHSAIRESYKSLAASQDLAASLASLGDLLDKHIRFEERELFPMIENTLNESELLDIKNKVVDRRAGG